MAGSSQLSPVVLIDVTAPDPFLPPIGHCGGNGGVLFRECLAQIEGAEVAGTEPAKLTSASAEDKEEETNSNMVR